MLIELFTSEGCSSCPPADKLLSEIDKTQPIRSAEVIVLSEHVDYWNQLGWSDPYSSSEFSDRQRDYASALHSEDVYTPEAVIDGQVGVVGSSFEKVRMAVEKAAARKKVSLELGVERASGMLRVHLHANGANGAIAHFAIAENEVESQVKRGENGGRMLSHVGVVRLLTSGKLGGDGSLDAILKVDPKWGGKGLRVVAFLEEKGSRRIVGVVEKKL